MSENILETEVSERYADNSLGKLLLDQGKIKERHVERILRYAKKKKIRFGEAAVKLRVASKADIEHALATQFEYPYLLKGEGGFSKELVAAYQPFTPKVESLRTLRSQLMVRWFNDQHNCLAIVSPESRAGRSYLAANLAIVFSQLGDRTLLVDADLQDSRQHKIFGLDNSIGLSTALAGRTSGELPINDLYMLKSLSVLTAGTPPPNPSELLSRDKFRQLTKQLCMEYDVVLFDTPPGNVSHAAESVANVCGGALMVSRLNHTRLEEATLFVDRLRAQAEIVGTVLSKF